MVAALIGYLESIAIAKTFAQKDGYTIDPTQELRAVGIANIVGSFFQSYPMTGSFSRTAVQNASEAKTALAGAFTGLLVVISLVWLTPMFFYIPKAALAAIIMMSVVHMVDIAAVKSIFRTKPKDLSVWMTSFLLCLLWNLEYGILVAIGLSFLIENVDTAVQSLQRLEQDTETGVWLPSPNHEITGLLQNWGSVHLTFKHRAPVSYLDLVMRPMFCMVLNI